MHGQVQRLQLAPVTGLRRGLSGRPPGRIARRHGQAGRLQLVGGCCGMCGLHNGTSNTGQIRVRLKAVLVARNSPEALLRVRPARNGAGPPWFSLESASPQYNQHGYLLNHNCGLLFFFNRPANKEELFRQDATWSMCKPGSDPHQVDVVRRYASFSGTVVWQS